MPTKLPTTEAPLIQDRDLAAAIETLLEPLSGKPLEKAQSAIRKVHASNVQGPFAAVLAVYEQAISKAAAQ